MKRDTRIITYPGGPAGTVYFPGFPGIYCGASRVALAELAERAGITPDALVILIRDLNLPLVVEEPVTPKAPKEE